MTLQSPGQRRTDPREPTTSGDVFVSDESLVLRNYDGAETHEVSVTLSDARGDLAFQREYRLSPGTTLSVATRLERGVYRIEVGLANGPDALAECLVGSGPDETALVEIGNGLLSISEGAR
jgi:hypothetical protein